MGRFEGKAAIVTGGAQGIGEAVAKRLASEGAMVAILDIQPEKAQRVAKDIPAKAGSAIAVAMDITDSQGVKRTVREVEDRFGKIDILVNNAGWDKFAPFIELEEELWDRLIAINLRGHMTVIRAVLDGMIRRNYGRIVNVASVAGKDGNANASAYSSGKAGAIGLTKSLGKELADTNIAVNAVTPAGAKTRILDQMSKEHVQRMLSKVPRARFLEIHEFTSLVCWLSSEENSFSTAAVFDISGGRSTY